MEAKTAPGSWRRDRMGGGRDRVHVRELARRSRLLSEYQFSYLHLGRYCDTVKVRMIGGSVSRCDCFVFLLF